MKMSVHLEHCRPFAILITILAWALAINGMGLYQVRLVESDKGRLVATSNINYALTSSSLMETRNWSCVSVNGDDVLIFSLKGDKIQATRSTLSNSDAQLIKRAKNELENRQSGYTHLRYGPNPLGETMMMKSSNGRPNGGSYSSSYSRGLSTTMSRGSTYQLNDFKITMQDDSNFSVSKSDLPYGWAQVFFNGNLVTLVYKDGRVQMQPVNKLDRNSSGTINKLRREARAMQSAQMKQFADTMSASMNMFNNVFSNMMRNLPKPPSFDSSSVFGPNYPFGPNNNPFSPERGWPFGPDGTFAYVA